MMSKHFLILHWAVGVGLFGAMATAWILRTKVLGRTIPRAIRPIVVALAFVLTFAGAGGYRVVYGSVGSLGLTLELNATAIEYDADTALEMWINVTNSGTTVVRWFPNPSFHLLAPGGIEIDNRWGCPMPTLPQFWGVDDSDLIELAPGESIQRHGNVELRGGDDRECGVFNLSGSGIYTAFAQVGPPSAPAYSSLPVWSQVARSEPVNLRVF